MFFYVGHLKGADLLKSAKYYSFYLSNLLFLDTFTYGVNESWLAVNSALLQSSTITLTAWKCINIYYGKHWSRLFGCLLLYLLIQ